jgi:hypothetical protein
VAGGTDESSEGGWKESTTTWQAQTPELAFGLFSTPAFPFWIERLGTKATTTK